jgi:hypothetical protein
MTDTTKYKNVSLKHSTYSTLKALSKLLLPDTELSISKTVETIVNKEAKKYNGKYRESIINSNVIELFGDRLSPEQHLWVSVLVKAAEDALNSNEYDEALKAIHWFKDNSVYFKKVCAFAGKNSEYVRKKILNRALKKEEEILKYISSFKVMRTSEVYKTNVIPILGEIS